MPRIDYHAQAIVGLHKLKKENNMKEAQFGTPIVTADNIREGREMSIRMGALSAEQIRRSEALEAKLRAEEMKQALKDNKIDAVVVNSTPISVGMILGATPEQVQATGEDNLEETSRKLATITFIKALRPIEGADRIEIATFTTNGWQCVVGKGEFKVGQPAVFFEIDSFLPKEDRYAVLEGRCNKAMKGKEGYRIKSIKMKGEISQGFAMPCTAFPEVIDSVPPAEGTDVTKLLGVQLWQMPIQGGTGFNIGRPKGNFPTHLVKKTDQERIQSMGNRAIVDLFNHSFEVSEKLDGTSVTMGWHANRNFFVCSRNLELTPPGKEVITYTDGDGNEQTKEIEVNSVYWDMAHKYRIEERLSKYCMDHDVNLAIQGEICGPGIQKNTLELKEVQFFVFDIFNIDNQRYVAPAERKAIIEWMNGYDVGEKIQQVPLVQYTDGGVPIPYQKITPHYLMIQDAMKEVDKIVEERSKDPAYQGVLGDDTIWGIFFGKVVDQVIKDLLIQAQGKVFTGGKSPREGLVFKSVQNPMISFKVINNDFLLKDKD